MAVMEYDDAVAEKLEAVYLGSDIVAQRVDTLRRLNICAGEDILDIGSGPGFLATDMAQVTGPTGRVLGVDLSDQFVARAKARNGMSWLEYQVADAVSLPIKNETFDVVVSTQVAEYVPDIHAFCCEIYRVLRPGGRALVLATDWEAVCWHSNNRERMECILAAFAPHCADSRLPRTLKSRLQNAGLEFTDVSYFPIVNADRYAGCYSEGLVPFISDYIQSKQTLPTDELVAWANELDELSARGEYFFSTGRFSFLVSKPE